MNELSKRPTEPYGHTIYINNDLHSMQKIVGGDIEIIKLHICGAVMICNEEGKIQEPPRNFTMGIPPFTDMIRGTVIICSADDEAGELCDVPFDLSYWKMILRKWGNE